MRTVLCTGHIRVTTHTGEEEFKEWACNTRRSIRMFVFLAMVPNIWRIITTLFKHPRIPSLLFSDRPCNCASSQTFNSNLLSTHLQDHLWTSRRHAISCTIYYIKHMTSMKASQDEEKLIVGSPHTHEPQSTPLIVADFRWVLLIPHRLNLNERKYLRAYDKRRYVLCTPLSRHVRGLIRRGSQWKHSNKQVLRTSIVCFVQISM